MKEATATVTIAPEHAEHVIRVEATGPNLLAAATAFGDALPEILVEIERRSGVSEAEEAHEPPAMTSNPWEAFWKDLLDRIAADGGDAADDGSDAPAQHREPLFGLTFTIDSLEQIHPNGGEGFLVGFRPGGGTTSTDTKRIKAKVEHAWEAQVGEEFVLIPLAMWDNRDCV